MFTNVPVRIYRARGNHAKPRGYGYPPGKYRYPLGLYAVSLAKESFGDISCWMWICRDCGLVDGRPPTGYTISWKTLRVYHISTSTTAFLSNHNNINKLPFYLLLISCLMFLTLSSGVRHRQFSQGSPLTKGCHPMLVAGKDFFPGA